MQEAQRRAREANVRLVQYKALSGSGFDILLAEYEQVQRDLNKVNWSLSNLQQ